MLILRTNVPNSIDISKLFLMFFWGMCSLHEIVNCPLLKLFSGNDVYFLGF